MKNNVLILYFSLIYSSFNISVRTATSSKKLNQYADLEVDVSDDHIPDEFKSALVNATLSTNPLLNQYSPNNGIVRLQRAIARLYSKQIKHELKPDKHVLVTIGGHEALYSTLQAHTSPDDEWIIIEPFWYKYKEMVKLTGGIPKYTNLKLIKKFKTVYGSDWKLDRRELVSLINDKTRGILFNNPNNPSGKVYSYKDLLFIAQLAEKHNILIISDEVHEWVVYDPYEHVNFAKLPGMFNRTITIGSASKAFGLAGWRIGWAYGPEHLLNKVKFVHNYMVHSSPTPQQDAVAYALEKEIENYGKPSSFFHRNMKESILRRDFLVKAFDRSGMLPVKPNGGNCMIVFLPEIKNNNNKSWVDFDEVEKILKVQGDPMTRFYGEKHMYLGKSSLRYCFSKSNATLTKAANNLLHVTENALLATWRHK